MQSIKLVFLIAIQALVLTTSVSFASDSDYELHFKSAPKLDANTSEADMKALILFKDENDRRKVALKDRPKRQKVEPTVKPKDFFYRIPAELFNLTAHFFTQLDLALLSSTATHCYNKADNARHYISSVKLPSEIGTRGVHPTIAFLTQKYLKIGKKGNLVPNKYLRELDLSGAEISNDVIKFLVEYFPGLRVLILKGCTGLNDEHIPLLSPLKELRHLDVSVTGVKGKTFRYLNKSLEVLRAHDCNLEDASIAELSHLRRLRELDISANFLLTGLNFGKLPVRLEILNASHITFTVAGLRGFDLTQHKRLSEIHLTGNPDLRNQLMRELLNRLPIGLREIHLNDDLDDQLDDNPLLEDADLFGLEKFSQLKYLSLSGQSIDMGEELCKRLPSSLLYLSIGSNPLISDAKLGVLANYLKKLEFLSIAHNTELLGTRLSLFKNLKQLDARGCRIRPMIIRSLRKRGVRIISQVPQMTDSMSEGEDERSDTDAGAEADAELSISEESDLESDFETALVPHVPNLPPLPDSDSDSTSDSDSDLDSEPSTTPAATTAAPSPTPAIPIAPPAAPAPTVVAPAPIVFTPVPMMVPPIISPYLIAHMAMNPFLANPLLANPFVGNPFMANPFMGNPFVGNPFVANPFLFANPNLFSFM